MSISQQIPGLSRAVKLNFRDQNHFPDAGNFTRNSMTFQEAWEPWIPLLTMCRWPMLCVKQKLVCGVKIDMATAVACIFTRCTVANYMRDSTAWLSQPHIFGGSDAEGYDPIVELRRDACTMHLPPSLSSCVYSLRSYRVDTRTNTQTNKQTLLKTSNVRHYAMTPSLPTSITALTSAIFQETT